MGISEQSSEMRQPALLRLMADVSDLIRGLEDRPEFHEVHLHLHGAQIALETEHSEMIDTATRQLSYWKKILTDKRDQG